MFLLESMLRNLLRIPLHIILCFIFVNLLSKAIFHYRWGGPLSQNWLNIQLALQKRILSRMQELGMTPGMTVFLVSKKSSNYFAFLRYD